MGRLWLALALMVATGTSVWAGDVRVPPERAEPVDAITGHPIAGVAEGVAGAESQRLADPAAVDHGTEPMRVLTHREHGCATGTMGLFLLGTALLGGLIVGLIAVVMLRRYRRPYVEGPSEPISLLVAEHAARASRKRTGLFALAGLGGLVAILGAGIPVFPWIFAIWTVPALRGYVLARSALRLVEAAGATAQLDGSTITVCANDHRAQLHLTPPELAAAKRRGVPAASTRE